VSGPTTARPRLHGLPRVMQVTRIAAAGVVVTLGAVAVLPVAALTACQARHLYIAWARLLTKTALAICGVRLSVHHEAPWSTAQTVFISNHPSTLDLFVLVALGLPNARFFLSGYLKKFLAVGILARLMGTFFTVPQTFQAERVRIFQRAAEELRRTGESVYLSPEGERVTGGRIGPFNKGSFHLASSLGAPIQPMYFFVPPEIDLKWDSTSGRARCTSTSSRSSTPADGASRTSSATATPCSACSKDGTAPSGRPIVSHRLMSDLPEQARPPVPALADRSRGLRLPFQGSTLVELLKQRAASQPGGLGYVFLRNGEIEDARWTWGELHQRSLAIAARLGASVSAGERALLLYPPGLEFIAAFFGCLQAGVIAVPVPLPQGTGDAAAMARLRAIAADASPAAVLTTAAVRTRWTADAGEICGPAESRTGRASMPGSLRCPWYTTDDLQGVSGAVPGQPAASNVAFLQYTSGSTASPRGVMVSHANLVHNLSGAFLLSGDAAHNPSVSWLPATHDMGSSKACSSLSIAETRPT